MGKASPPAAPDYSTFILASQQAAQSNAAAAKVSEELGLKQLEQQGIYSARAADLGDRYAQMAQDQAGFGKQQYEDIKPYLTKYMQSQLDFTGAAQANEEEQTKAAALSAQQAKDTYDQYKTVFMPKETQFADEAFGYATPARMDQAAGAARADVGNAFAAQKDAATRQLASYGIDPSQGAFQRSMGAMDISKAAASAAAGTMARTQTEAQGKQYEAAALEVGQKLPAQAIAQAGLGTQQATAGLAGSSIGGGGIAAGGNLLNAGTNAMGSPTAYAALNPYTNLTSSYGTTGTGLIGTGVQALGNQAAAIGAGVGATNSMYSAQMSNYQARQANSPLGAIGTIAGIGAKLATGGLFG